MKAKIKIEQNFNHLEFLQDDHFDEEPFELEIKTWEKILLVFSTFVFAVLLTLFVTNF